jgi:mono/diheme cytochrome c family protein
MWLVAAAVPGAAQTAADHPVTFSKDIAPILQKNCQQCHRPDSIAPMSLLTYEQARPYARAIKQRTQLAYVPGMRGVMPPWFLERTIGVQGMKDDMRLTDAEIATIGKWVDSGAPEGNRADLPPPVAFADNSRWFLGKPDLIISSPPVTVKPTAPDWWGTLADTPSDLPEDRYASSVEHKEINDLKPGSLEKNTDIGQGKSGIFVFHHNFLTVRRPDGQRLYVGEDDALTQDGKLATFSVGRNGDVFPTNAGRLVPAKGVFGWDIHTHSPGVGGDRTAALNVGIKFHPKGYTPEFVERGASSSSNVLEIRSDSDANRYDVYFVVPQPLKLTNFEPHMHATGIRMCMEAIFPRYTETLNCSGYDHNWVTSYHYDENSAPLIPKGTILHGIGWFDGTAKNANNIDPRNVTMWGRRSAQNMYNMSNEALYLTEEQYQQELAKRRKYLDLTNGWDTVIGCPDCFNAPPATSQTAAVQ